MSTGTWVVILVVAAVVLLAILVALYLRNRRTKLQRRFGSEYERAVQAQGGRLKAERDLAQRERLHDKLDIRPLSDESRERYAREWAGLQRGFVDDPKGALGKADLLVGDLLAERGYPTNDRGAQESALSVEHAHVMDRFREAHEISERNSRGEADTEQLRRATVNYRSLVDELLGADARQGGREER